MTHPLTKKLNTESMNNGLFKKDDEVIQTWAVERSEWLKKVAYEGVITPKMIDQAFQLEPESLEKKLSNELEYNLNPGQLYAVCKFIRAHYKENKA